MRKLLVGMLAVVILIGASALPSHAWWHGGPHPVVVGPRVVIGVGAPFVVAAPVFYPRAYVFPAPVVVAAPAPVVVAPPAPTVYAPSAPSWYYCQSPAGYYPSVPQCSAGWMQVAPQAR